MMGKSFIELKHSSKKYFNRTTYKYVLFHITIPIVIIFVLLVSVLVYDSYRMINTEKVNSTERERTVSRSFENTLSSMNYVAEVAHCMPHIAGVFDGNDMNFTNKLSEELQSITDSYSYIDSVFIMDKKSFKVYDRSGIYSYDEFFSKRYIYDMYDSSYWKKPIIYHSEPSRILSPSYVNSNGEKKAVIPIIYKKIGNVTSKNYLLLNVDLNNVMQLEPIISADSAGDYYIHNRYTNELFNINNDFTDIPQELLDEEFLTALSENPNSAFAFNLPSGKVLVSTYSKNDSIIGYTYLSIIPIKSIILTVIHDRVAYISLILLGIILAFFITYWCMIKIYEPIDYIERTLSVSESPATKNSIKNLMRLADDARLAKQQLNSALPYIQEKYLCSYLNSTEHYMQEDLKTQLKNTLQFPNKYFAVVLIQLSPTEKLFEEFNSSEYTQIQNGFYSVVKALFTSKFDCYVIPADNEVLDIALNPETDSFDTVHDVIAQIYELLKNDLALTILSIGVSSVYSDVTGLKAAHDEAKKHFFAYGANFVANKATFENSHANTVVFATTDENDLFRSLVSLDSTKIKTTIHEIFKKNLPMDENNVRQLYNHIINTVFRYARTNNVIINTQKLDYEFIGEILNHPVDEIGTEVDNLIDFIVKSQSEKQRGNRDITGFIKDNFSNPDLSVKLLADKFKISTSGVSAEVKSQTGMGVRDFINSLRIEKAKEMLLNDEIDINAICEECGFVSRQTFFRVFKNTVGLTSSEYRTQNLKK